MEIFLMKYTLIVWKVALWSNWGREIASVNFRKHRKRIAARSLSSPEGNDIPVIQGVSWIKFLLRYNLCTMHCFHFKCIVKFWQMYGVNEMTTITEMVTININKISLPANFLKLFCRLVFPQRSLAVIGTSDLLFLCI